MEIQSLQSRIKQASELLQSITDDLVLLANRQIQDVSLPGVQQINARVCIVSSRQMRLESWDPFFYNVQLQRERLSLLMAQVGKYPGKVAKSMSTLRNSGFVDEKLGRVKFHPDFIKAAEPAIEATLKIAESLMNVGVRTGFDKESEETESRSNTPRPGLAS